MKKQKQETHNPGIRFGTYKSLNIKRVTTNILMLFIITTACAEKSGNGVKGMRKLPLPDTTGSMSLEKAIENRRSVRSFKDKSLNDKQIGQILWAAQGITGDRRGFRAAPSAGATYPLEVYMVTSSEIMHYVPKDHSVETIETGDYRGKIKAAALGQESVGEASAIVIITAISERTTKRYGQRAHRYIYTEAGHAGQNVLLQVVSLGLGAVPVGAFDEDKIAEILNCKGGETPLYIIPIGYSQ
jgi:SagB-type dehydrogenase family enzyme